MSGLGNASLRDDPLELAGGTREAEHTPHVGVELQLAVYLHDLLNAGLFHQGWALNPLHFAMPHGDTLWGIRRPPVDARCDPPGAAFVPTAPG